MAFPASTLTLANALDGVRQTALRIKQQTQSLRIRSAAGDVPRADFVKLQRLLNQSVVQFDQFVTVPGLAQYAQDQLGDATLDLAAEYSAMRTAALTLRDWIFNAIPRSASGAAELRTVDAEGNEVDLVVTPAQSAGFRTEADSFIATIE